MSVFKDITGQRFGKLVVLARAPRGGAKHRQAKWSCRCDCGNMSDTDGGGLRAGRVTSCGCVKRQTWRKAVAATVTTGYRPHPLYPLWDSMVRRCHRPTNTAYGRYGARGITVCHEWRSDLLAFAAYMGDRPSPQHSIDRINNDGNYEPGNVRWATRHVQASNKSNTVWVEVNGHPVEAQRAVREFGYSRWAVYSQLKRLPNPYEANR